MSYHVMEFYILCHDYHGIPSLYYVIKVDQYHFIMILYSRKILWQIKFDEFMVDNASIKLTSISINILLALSF